MNSRQKIRVGPKVLHRHRVGGTTFRRVSELVFVGGRPKALLGWVDLGGVRTPLYICELDEAKLRRHRSLKHVYYYDAVTVDPRYEDVLPEPADVPAAR